MLAGTKALHLYLFLTGMNILLAGMHMFMYIFLAHTGLYAFLARTDVYAFPANTGMYAFLAHTDGYLLLEICSTILSSAGIDGFEKGNSPTTRHRGFVSQRPSSQEKT